MGLEIAGIIGRQDDRVVIVGRDQIGEISVRRIEMEGDGALVDGDRAALGQNPGKDRQRDRAVGWIGQPVHRRHHIGGSHAPAVMECDVVANLESPDAAVLVGGPALGKHRLEPQVGSGHGQIFARLAE